MEQSIAPRRLSLRNSANTKLQWAAYVIAFEAGPTNLTNDEQHMLVQRATESLALLFIIEAREFEN